MSIPKDIVSAASDMVLATESHRPTGTRHIDLFLDADMSVLGAMPDTYRHYMASIRKEYGCYDDIDYFFGRKAFIESMWARDQIFITYDFAKEYERMAHHNLTVEEGLIADILWNERITYRESARLMYTGEVQMFEPDDVYDNFIKEYNRLHECCPVCGSKSHMSTLLGYTFDRSKPEDYKDLNRCTCSECGDTHTCHERIPEVN